MSFGDENKYFCLPSASGWCAVFFSYPGEMEEISSDFLAVAMLHFSFRHHSQVSVPLLLSIVFSPLKFKLYCVLVVDVGNLRAVVVTLSLNEIVTLD